MDEFCTYTHSSELAADASRWIAYWYSAAREVGFLPAGRPRIEHRIVHHPGHADDEEWAIIGPIEDLADEWC